MLNKKSTQFYQSNVFDCVAKGSAGQNCLNDDHCSSNLGCDASGAGSQTFTCLNLNGAVCVSPADCVNNLKCIAGKCGCDVS